MRTPDGGVPEKAQARLRETLRVEGYFLSCLCVPEGDIRIVEAEDAALYQRAVIQSRELLAPDVCRVTLEPATPLYYHAGIITPGNFLIYAAAMACAAPIPSPACPTSTAIWNSTLGASAAGI